MARAHRITAAKALKARWERHHSQPELWFWDRLDRSGGPEACWPWTGKIVAKRGGYGRLAFKGRETGAHRLALSLATGQDGDGLFACHRCDNPICCNPAHLFWGTPLENTRDSISKGRRRGPHPRKIDLDEVRKLRSEGHSYSKMAAHFGVHQSSIGRALKRAACLRARAAERREG